MKTPLAVSFLIICSIVLVAGDNLTGPSRHLPYPETPKSSQVDDYHGTKVADPYRWLENDRSPETLAWVKAENRVTSQYLSGISFRGKLGKRLDELQNYVRYTSPVVRGEYVFFTKNDGLQNQSVVYVQKGWSGTPKVLLDPNRFSADGTSKLDEFSVSKDGRYVAYTISTGGSDWQEGHVLEVPSGKTLPEKLEWLKVGNLAWAPDGFFYSRYPAPAAGRELTSKNVNQMVYFHRPGTAQSTDKLIYENKTHPERFNTVYTSFDEDFAFLDLSDRGSGKDGNALYYRDLRRKTSAFTPVVSEISDDRYDVIGQNDGKFLIETNAKAPNSKVSLYDPERRSWTDIVQERQQPLQQVLFAGGKLIVEYSEDVASRIYVYGLDGKESSEIQLPAKGVAREIDGNPDSPLVFYQFSALNIPETIFRYDLRSGANTTYRKPQVAGFDPDKYESKEVFYRSKDGTRVPMFLVYKKGLHLDGTNPTLLYAYGGFNIVEYPTFSPLRLALLEQGFVYASANIRGGGEYGDKWHQAGMRFHKQNVFEDFICAAEWLIQNRYTTKDKLSIYGASNGGLLVGAAVNQRPDLFRAAIAHAGVMDMLRFQKFTIGWNWIADYGSSDDPAQFKYLRAYSPVHNVKSGVTYPAMLVTTADHDDRVIPGHSFKYAAALQANVAPAHPVLIRIDTNSGHGASSTTKHLEQTTDDYAFLMYNLGVQPAFSSERTAAAGSQAGN